MKNLSILRLFTLLLALALLTFSGCSVVASAEVADNSFTDTIAPETPWRGIVAHSAIADNSAYYYDEFRDGMWRLMRTDLATDEVVCPCPVESCTHTDVGCAYVYERDPVTGPQMFGDWYIVPVQQRKADMADKIGTYGYIPYNRFMRLYHRKTGESRDIFADRYESGSASNRVLRLGDCLYHISYARTGERCMTDIECYNLETGEQSVILTHDYKVTLAAVSETRLYLCEKKDDAERYYSIKGDGSGLQAEPTMQRAARYIYQNKIYTVDGDDLLVNDLATGEVSTLFEGETDFFISEGRLYFMTQDDTSALRAEREACNEKSLTETGFSAIRYESPYQDEYRALNDKIAYTPRHLWVANLDGSNRQPVLDFADQTYLVCVEYVHEGWLMGYVFGRDPKTGLRENMPRPCRVNLASGEVSLLVDPGAVLTRLK